MESDWVYCHFRQKKDSFNNFFEKKHVIQFTLEMIHQFLNQIESMLQVTQAALRPHLAQKGITYDYLLFHLNEDEKASSHTRSVLPLQLQELFNRVICTQVNIYPEKLSSQTFAYFEYSIMYDDFPSNQVLCIATDEKGTILSINWES